MACARSLFIPVASLQACPGDILDEGRERPGIRLGGQDEGVEAEIDSEMRQYFARCSGGPTTAWSSSVAGPVGAFVSAPADLARVTTHVACGAVDGEVVPRRHRRLLPVHERADPSVRQPLVSPDREVYVQAARRAGRTGRIRTTWPPDLSAPFLDSLLDLSAGAC